MENNKPVFYMLVGLPASGKSSESDRLGDVIVRSSDYLRDKLCGDINDMKNNGAVFTILQIEVCVKRNEERERTVPKEAMERMKRFLEPPTFAEGWDEIRVVKNWDEKENSDGGDR